MPVKSVPKKASREKAPPAETLASSAYTSLKRDILGGELKPGSKLNIRQLCLRYDIGLAPMREALNRLRSDAFVTQVDQRGFRVSDLTEQDLDDLLRARCWLNEVGLRRSIASGDLAWEESLIIAHHRLQRTPRYRPSDKSLRNPDWELAHRRFHETVIGACGSNWLIGFCNLMFDAAERYRLMGRSVGSGSQTPPRGDTEHNALVEAIIERRVEDAVAIMNEHLESTAEFVRRAVKDVSTVEGKPRARKPGPRK